MYKKEGSKYFQGNSSLDPTKSSLEAEAIALLTAVQQLGRLSYKHVTFQGDCKVWCVVFFICNTVWCVVKATIYVNIEAQRFSFIYCIHMEDVGSTLKTLDLPNPKRTILHCIVVYGKNFSRTWRISQLIPYFCI